MEDFDQKVIEQLKRIIEQMESGKVISTGFSISAEIEDVEMNDGWMNRRCDGNYTITLNYREIKFRDLPKGA